MRPGGATGRGSSADRPGRAATAEDEARQANTFFQEGLVSRGVGKVRGTAPMDKSFGAKETVAKLFPEEPVADPGPAVQPIDGEERAALGRPPQAPAEIGTGAKWVPV